MSDMLVRCPRCGGRKSIFYLNGGYTLMDMGAPAVACPFCNGVGKIKKISEVIQDLISENENDLKNSANIDNELVAEKPKKRKYTKKSSN